MSNGGLAAWGVAGGAAYYFYLPEKEKADAEVLRAANAERLMKQKNYVEFVKEHEAKQSKTGQWCSEDGLGQEAVGKKREPRKIFGFLTLVAERSRRTGRAVSPRAPPTA